MLQLQRQNDIMRLLEKDKELTVKELCGALYCSPATIRRDLAELEKKGLLKRSFGGAVVNEGFSNQLPLAVRGSKHTAAKKKICMRAASFINSGETIFLDASTTVFFLVPYLREISDITVITNNPHLNIALSELGIRNFSTGGEMLTSSIALIGSEAERFVRGIHADAVFFSSRGVYNGSICDSSKGERDMKIAMLESSTRHYFLCDSSKKQQQFPYLITDVSRVDEVIEE